jgi:hypothetical protein
MPVAVTVQAKAAKDMPSTTLQRLVAFFPDFDNRVSGTANLRSASIIATGQMR